MPVTTPHVGVRAFFDRGSTDIYQVADLSTIGVVFMASDASETLFPLDTPVHFTTDDTDMVAGAGTTGGLYEVIDAVGNAGIVASVVAVRVDHTGADIDAKMAKIVGSAASLTGVYALTEAQGETGAEPDIIVAPGFTSQRLSSAANPAATAIDAVCNRIVTAIGVCDTPSASKAAAIEWAADFAETLNLVAVGQQVRVMGPAGTPVSRPASSYVAALIAAYDKSRGAPYYNPGNQELGGILGPDRSVSWRVDDPDCEANFLIQRGVNSIIQKERNRTSRATNSPQGKTFWGFFNTSSDTSWRGINMVRTRKAIREVIPRTLVKHIGRNLGSHLIPTIGQGLEAFLAELHGLPEPAILSGWQVLWPRSLNTNAELAAGGSSFRVLFQEAPPLVDLKIYTEPNEASFDILASEIETAMKTYNVGGTLA